MKHLDIEYCPSTLKSGNKTYSSVALKHLFNGKKVSHVCCLMNHQHLPK